MAIHKARESLEKAVEIDPEFAMAYLAVERCLFRGGLIRPAANQALEKAYSPCPKNATEKERLQIEADYAYQMSKRTKTNAAAFAKECAAKYPKE